MPTRSLDFCNLPKTETGNIVNMLAETAHKMAEEHGFYEDEGELEDFLAVNDQPEFHAVATTNFTLAQLAKIASEVGEAVGAIQHGEYYELYEELADIIIRTLDLAGYLDLRIGDAIMLKMEKNKSRPYKHGKLC